MKWIVYEGRQSGAYAEPVWTTGSTGPTGDQRSSRSPVPGAPIEFRTLATATQSQPPLPHATEGYEGRIA